jgi:hypothetical protein
MTSVIFLSAACDFSHAALFFVPRRAQKMYRNYYIAPGTLANLQHAFTEGCIWGLPGGPGGRRGTWCRLKTGDLVFFYAESPKSTVIAHGEIQNSFLVSIPAENSPLYRLKIPHP